MAGLGALTWIPTFDGLTWHCMGAHDSISTTACYLVIMTIVSCKKKACKFPKFTMASHIFFSAEIHIPILNSPTRIDLNISMTNQWPINDQCQFNSSYHVGHMSILSGFDRPLKGASIILENPAGVPGWPGDPWWPRAICRRTWCAWHYLSDVSRLGTHNTHNVSSYNLSHDW